MVIIDIRNSSNVHVSVTRSVGGLRISLYNAVSVAETEVLINFMKDFMARHRQ